MDLQQGPVPGARFVHDRVQSVRRYRQRLATGDQTSDLQSRFAAASSPSYRLVVDMGDLDAATIIQTTGESGVPFDSHYGDFIGRWLANVPLPLPWTDSSVNGAAKQTLTLNP